MKLLVIIPYYEPAWAYGGPPRLMSTIARALANRHQVTVLTTDVLDGQQRAQPKNVLLGGVKVYRFPTQSNTLAWKSKIILPKHYQPELQQQIEQADFVYLSDFRHWLNAAALQHLLRLQKPYSLAAYGQIQKPFDWKYPLKVIFDLLWGKSLVQHASLLIAQTEHERQDYLGMGGEPNQIQLLPLMEQSPTAEELQQQGIFRKKYGLSAETKLLLFVGRINKLKGIDVLLHSVAKIQNAKLVIVGRDDGYLSKIHKTIQSLGMNDRVIQTGPLYGADNAAAYCDADWFVFTPTHYEETSLAAVRALSFGLPVITTPQAELPWLDDYRAGYIVPNEVAAIVDKLTEVLSNDTLRAEFSNNAKRLFTEHYEQSRVLANLEHAFHTTLQRLS